MKKILIFVFIFLISCSRVCSSAWIDAYIPDENVLPSDFDIDWFLDQNVADPVTVEDSGPTSGWALEHDVIGDGDHQFWQMDNNLWIPSNSTGWTYEFRFKLVTTGVRVNASVINIYDGTRYVQWEITNSLTFRSSIGLSGETDNVDFSQNVWHTVRVTMVGNEVNMYFNGVRKHFGTATTGTGLKRLLWGDTSDFSQTGVVRWDYIKFDLTGAIPPSRPTQALLLGDY